MYCVAILKNVYLPDYQGERRVFFADDTFESIDEAQDYIDELEDHTYYTSNNEAGRPEYIIVEEDTRDYIESGRNGDLSNYDWDDNDCTNGIDNECCGECSQCNDMMIDQDIDYILKNEVHHDH